MSFIFQDLIFSAASSPVYFKVLFCHGLPFEVLVLNGYRRGPGKRPKQQPLKSRKSFKNVQWKRVRCLFYTLSKHNFIHNMCLGYHQKWTYSISWSNHKNGTHMYPLALWNPLILKPGYGEVVTSIHIKSISMFNSWMKIWSRMVRTSPRTQKIVYK